jgi:DNA invertase Pin-like site-specific DNA recombinase
MIPSEFDQPRRPGMPLIFKEKTSGAKTDRPRDLLNILDTVAKAGASFKSLADAWADTTTPHGKLLLTVLGGLAEFERELIRARTAGSRLPSPFEHGAVGL